MNIDPSKKIEKMKIADETKEGNRRVLFWSKGRKEGLVQWPKIKISTDTVKDTHSFLTLYYIAHCHRILYTELFMLLFLCCVVLFTIILCASCSEYAVTRVTPSSYRSELH